MTGNFNLYADESPLVEGWIYKVALMEAWSQAEANGAFAGAPVDVADGYIHLSTASQAPETLAKHFANQAGLVAAGFVPADLGPALRWEPSRGGQLFPHLYAPLPTALAKGLWRVEWDGARHRLLRQI
jgi:uncharacterized protein (DUF952 family)